jgi:hypothetical protein
MFARIVRCRAAGDAGAGFVTSTAAYFLEAVAARAITMLVWERWWRSER